MSRRRWIKFWPQDWQRDPALRACSLAARGLWMELLCIAHESEPYGHVTLNGRAMTEAEMASIAGRPRREILPLIAELERAGVFSRTPEGVVYSRRLVRDDVAAQTGRAHIRKRWDAASDRDSPPNRETGKTLSAQEARSQMQEASVPEERHGAAVLPPDSGHADSRDEFWRKGLAAYRRMTGRGDAPSRAFLGRLLRDLGDDCAAAMALIREAEDLRPGDPGAWLQAAARSRGTRNAGRGGEHPLSHAAQMRAVAEIFNIGPERPAWEQRG